MDKEGLKMKDGTQLNAAINLETLMRSQQVMNADLALRLSSYPLQSNLFIINNQSQLQFLKKSQQKMIIMRHKILQIIRIKFKQNQSKKHYHSVQNTSIIRQTIEEKLRILEREINSTSHNPILDHEHQSAKSGANFRVEYMGMLADNMGISLQRLQNVRKISNCVLPMMLTSQGGLLNGSMILQYTSVALVSENKVLRYPTCIDTVPISANIEDHYLWKHLVLEKEFKQYKMQHILLLLNLCVLLRNQNLQKQSYHLRYKSSEIHQKNYSRGQDSIL